MSDIDRNPFPYPGARGLLTNGKPAAPVSQDAGILAQLAASLSDAATVMLFGNAEQKATVNAWMDRNREMNR